METRKLGYACDCCALATANGDVSGCESHCGDDHVYRLAEFGLGPGEVPVISPVGDDDDITVARCAGCGDDFYGVSYVVELVATA